MKYFEKNQFLNKSQHGFRHKKSTTSALLEVLERLTEALDDRDEAQIALCDLSKAFDTIQHHVLLNKLKYYGVRGLPYQLVASYLKNRRQVVVVNGDISESQAIKSGVPQGSVLGPVFFIIFVNDLPESVRAWMSCQFADDTSFLMRGKDRTELTHGLLNIMDDARAWFNANKMKINEDKTQMLTFSRIQGEMHSVKFLGLHLDNKLTWSVHISQTSKKLCSALYTLRRMKILSTHHIARITYFAHFHSIATYGIMLWGASSEASKILLLQKKAIRILCGLGYQQSCREFFKRERILTVTSVYIMNYLSHVHSHIQSFQKQSDVHSYQTRNKDALQIPFHRLERTKRNTDFWGIKLYNRLPTNIKGKSPREFRTQVKELLLRCAFYSLDEYMNSDEF